MAEKRPSQPADAAEAVLSKAFRRAAESLSLSQREQGVMLGLSEASISRIHGAQRSLAPDSQEGQLALLFLRVYRSLSGMLGGDAAQMHSWFHGHNLHLLGTPAALVLSIEGLVTTAQYLDALRGAP